MHSVCICVCIMCICMHIKGFGDADNLNEFECILRSNHWRASQSLSLQSIDHSINELRQSKLTKWSIQLTETNFWIDRMLFSHVENINGRSFLLVCCLILDLEKNKRNYKRNNKHDCKHFFLSQFHSHLQAKKNDQYC